MSGAARTKPCQAPHLHDLIILLADLVEVTEVAEAGVFGELKVFPGFGGIFGRV